MADVLYFKNNAVKQRLASVFYVCLAALPFFSCLLWLYMRYLLRHPIHGMTFWVSLIIEISWILGWHMFGSVPIIKAICLLSVMDCALLWQWLWTWQPPDDISELPPLNFGMKIFFLFLFTCLILTLAWMIEPLTGDFSALEKITFGALIWLAGSWIIFKRGFEHKTHSFLLFLFFCFLCFANMNISAAYAAETAFQILCRTGTAEETEQAIQSGAGDRETYTSALFDALNNANPGVIRVLLKYGAKVDHRMNGVAPIHLAALRLARGFRKGEKIPPRLPLSSFTDLLEAGADINMPSGTGTPLHFALIARGTAPQFVRFLLARGADVNAQAGYYGETPLMRAVSSATSPEIINTLLDSGANIEAKSKHLESYPYYPDMTVLMWAVKHNRIEAAKLLIDRGARINARNSRGETAYDIAVENCIDPAVCGILKKAGAGINLPDHKGQTPLMLAAWNGTSTTVKLLLNQGANPEMKDLSGYTAYEHARRVRETENANVIFYKGRALSLFFPKIVYIMLLALPVFLLIELCIRRFVQYIIVRNRTIAGAVFLVVTNTLLPFLIPAIVLLPLPVKISILSRSLCLIFAGFTGIAWREKQNLSRLKFCTPQILLILMTAIAFWTKGA
jgi:ankyrin repeat protein